MSGIIGALDAAVLRTRILEAVRSQSRSVPLLTSPANTEDFRYLLPLLVRNVYGEAIGPKDEARLADIGAAWAARNHPPGELAAAYQVPLRAIVGHLREIGVSLGLPSATVLGTVDRVVNGCNTLAAAVAEGYRCADHHRQRADFLRRLLFGTATAGACRDTAHFGLDPTREYLAVRGRPVPGLRAEELALAHGLSVEHGGNPTGMATVVGTDLIGVLATRPDTGADTKGIVGLGPARPLHQLSESFRMASRALETAARHGLTGVHEFGDLGLLPAVCTDGEVTDALSRRYLDPLGHGESADEIADSLHTYLLEGMHVTRTAERLFVHPNTVRYRIGRFENLAGVSLRSNPTAVFELLWALRHRSARAH